MLPFAARPELNLENFKVQIGKVVANTKAYKQGLAKSRDSDCGLTAKSTEMSQMTASDSINTFRKYLYKQEITKNRNEQRQSVSFQPNLGNYRVNWTNKKSVPADKSQGQRQPQYDFFKRAALPLAKQKDSLQKNVFKNSHQRASSMIKKK